MQATLKRLNERRSQDHGFTLIELLVVIVILGILAAVVVFAVGGITDRGEESACDATSKAVEVASEAFYAQSEVNPAAYAASITALEDANLLRVDDDMTRVPATGATMGLTVKGGTITYNTDGTVTDNCS